MAAEATVVTAAVTAAEVVVVAMTVSEATMVANCNVTWAGSHRLGANRPPHCLQYDHAKVLGCGQTTFAPHRAARS